MYANELENRSQKEIIDGVRMRSYWGEQMLVCHIEVDEGAVVPPHSHPHEQSGVVLSGEMGFVIGGESFHFKAGDSYIIAGGVEHEARGLQPSRLFEIFSPVREEYKY